MKDALQTPPAFFRCFQGLRAALFLALLILVTQAPFLGNGFVYDDDIAIRTNLVVTNAQWENIFISDFWGNTNGPNTGTYRPLVVITFLAQWAATPGSAVSFHILNVIFLLILVLFAFRLFERWFPAPLPWLALSLFALHPVNSEVFHNIVQRSELMSGIGIIAYLLVLSKNEKNKLVNVVFAALIFLLALLCKENAVAAPILLVLTERGRPDGARSLREVFRRHRLSLGLAVVVLGIYFFLRNLALGGPSTSVPFLFNPTVAMPDLWRHLNSGWLLFRYLLRFFYPFPQPMEWVYNQLPVFGPGHEAFLAAIWLPVLALALFALRGFLKKNTEALGLLWFAVLILPVIQAFVTVTVLFADRCLFLPGLGLSLLVASTGQRLSSRINRGGRLLLGLWLVMLTGLAAYQLYLGPIWRDNLSLFTTLAENSPRCENAQTGAAKFLYHAGKKDEAFQKLNQSLAITTLSEEAWIWVAKLQLDGGDPEGALRSWEKAKALLDPRDWIKYEVEQAKLLEIEGQLRLKDNPEQSLVIFNALSRLRPTNYGAWTGRALALALMKRNDEAKIAAKDFLVRFPENPMNEANLGSLAEIEGNDEEALKFYDQALQKNPKSRGLRHTKAALLKRMGRIDEAKEM